MRYIIITLLTLATLVVSAKQTTKVYENPDYIFTCNCISKVTKVEIKKKETVLTLHCSIRNGYWIRFGSNTKLRDNSGRYYSLKGIDSECDLQIDKMQPYHPDEFDVRLIFEPLAKDVTEIDFNPDDEDDGIFGIQLTGLPADCIINKPEIDLNYQLPQPVYGYGKARLKGHIAYFRKGMLKHLILSFEGHEYISSVNGMVKIPIDDNGCFDIEVPLYRTMPAYIGNGTLYLQPDETTEITVLLGKDGYQDIDNNVYPTAISVENGPLKSLANEINFTFTLRNCQWINYRHHIKEINDYRLVAASYDDVCKRINEICDSIDNKIEKGHFSDAYKQLAHLRNKVNRYNELNIGILIPMDSSIKISDTRQKEFIDGKAKHQLELYDMLLDITSDPRMVLQPDFNYFYSRLGDTNMQYSDNFLNEKKTLGLIKQIERNIVIDDEQKAILATLPEDNQRFLNNKMETLMERIRDIRSKEGYRIHEEAESLSEVPDSLLHEALMKKYGDGKHWVFFNQWFVTGNYSQSINRNIIQKIQKEFPNSDVVFIHVAQTAREHELWIQQAADLQGEHYMLDFNSWDALRKKVCGSSYKKGDVGFELLKPDGTQVWRKPYYPDIEELRKWFRQIPIKE